MKYRSDPSKIVDGAMVLRHRVNMLKGNVLDNLDFLKSDDSKEKIYMVI